MNKDTQPTMEKLLEQTRQVHTRLEAARAELEVAEVMGSANGGQVTVTMMATGAVRQVVIQPDAVDPQDTSALSAMVLAAFNDAHRRTQQLTQEIIAPMTDGLSLFSRPSR